MSSYIYIVYMYGIYIYIVLYVYNPILYIYHRYIPQIENIKGLSQNYTSMFWMFRNESKKSRQTAVNSAVMSYETFTCHLKA